MLWYNVTTLGLNQFWGAEKVLQSDCKQFVFALWNHSQAQGWYLYQKKPRSMKYKFVANALCLSDLLLEITRIKEAEEAVPALAC